MTLTASLLQPAKRLWAGLLGLYALLLIQLVFYVTDAQHSSGMVKLLALLVFGAAVIVGITALWVSDTRAEALRGRVIRLRPIWLAGTLAGLAVFGLLMRPEFIYAEIALIFALSTALYDWVFFGGTAALEHPRRWLWVMAGTAVIVTGIRIYGLTVYPRVEIFDEPWLLTWASGFARNGQLKDWIMRGGGHDVHRVYALRGLWFRLVGVGFWEGRLYSLILTSLPITFTALAARNLYDRRTAWFSAIYLFSSGVLMITVRIRHDIELTSIIALSLWIFTEAVKRENNGLHLLAGLVMGLGPLAHYDATFYGAALFVACYAPRFIQQRRDDQRRWPELGGWLFVLGGLIGVGVVLAIQILPNWDLFLKNRDPRHPRDLAQFFELMKQHVLNIGSQHSWIELVLIPVGLLAALIRRQKADWLVILMVLLGQLGLGLMTHAAYDYLMSPLVPFYALLVGSLFGERLAKISPPRIAQTLVFLFALIICAATRKTPRRTRKKNTNWRRRLRTTASPIRTARRPSSGTSS